MQSFAKRVWIAVGIVGVLLLVAGLVGYLFYGVLVIFAGVVLGIFLARLSTLVSRFTGLSYRVTYGIVVVLLIGVVVGALTFMGARIAMEAGEFIEELGEAAARLEEQLQQYPWWDEFEDWRSRMAETLSSRQAFVTVTSVAYLTMSALIGGVVVAVLGFYFAVQPERYRKGFLSLVPPTSRNRVAEVLDMIVERLWFWVLGRLAGMVVVGTSMTLGLWLLGVPLPIPLGVLAGLLNFIPNFGPLIALVPAVLLGLQQGGETVFYVVILFLAVQTVESYFLTPMIDQHQVAMPPGLTLSVQLLFGLLAGPVGLMLAVPLTVVITLLLREFYVKDILDSRPVPGT